jgi:hypothetical protein
MIGMKTGLDAPTRAQLKNALGYLSKTGACSYRQMVEEIAEIESHPDFHAAASRLDINSENLKCALSDTALSAYATKSERKMRGPELAVYLWVRLCHPAAWRAVTAESESGCNDPFVVHFREIFGKVNPKARRFDVLSGTYALYRPHFLNPAHEIMVCELALGDDDGLPCDARFTMAYQDGSGAAERTATGKIVPLVDRAALILSDRRNGIFMLYVDQVRTDGRGEKTRMLFGTMAASCDNRQSWATPFVAIRADPRPVSVGVIPRAATLPAEVVTRLAYGYVDWRPEALIAPVHRDAPAPRTRRKPAPPRSRVG